MRKPRSPSHYQFLVGTRNGRYWRVDHGLLHRVAGPAIELEDGIKEWWLSGGRVAWQAGDVLEPWRLFYSPTGCRYDIGLFPGYGSNP